MPLPFNFFHAGRMTVITALFSARFISIAVATGQELATVPDRQQAPPTEDESSTNIQDESPSIEHKTTGIRVMQRYPDGSPYLTHCLIGCITRTVIESPPGCLSHVSMKLDCNKISEFPRVRFSLNETGNLEEIQFSYSSLPKRKDHITKLRWGPPNQFYFTRESGERGELYVGRRWNRRMRDGKVMRHEWYENGRRTQNLKNENYSLPDPPPWVFYRNGRIKMKPELGGKEIGVKEIADYLRAIVGDFVIEPLPAPTVSEATPEATEITAAVGLSGGAFLSGSTESPPEAGVKK